MEDILNAVVLFMNFVGIPALAYGSQLALGALGVTLIFAVLRFAFFAHGDLMAFATMLVVLLTWLLQSWGVGIDPLPTALLAIPFAALGAVALSLGIDRARDFKEWAGLEEGLSIRVSQGLTVVLALIAMIALFWFLQRTRMGKAMRAYSDNEDLALLSGVDPAKVVAVTWVIAAVLATLAGALYGLDKSFKPFTYFQLLLPIFAAAIVGGIGQPIGAVVGGYVVAFSEVMVTYAYRKVIGYVGPSDWMPDGLMQLLSTDYKFAVSFVILVLVLLVRPTGLFRGRSF